MKNPRMFKAVLTLVCSIFILCCMLNVNAKETEKKKEKTVKCQLSFSIKGWSVIYKKGDGEGKITCDNGQSRQVNLKVRGSGLTFGKTEIIKGHGTFSKVSDINELFGWYAASEAHAGAGRSAAAQAMTKGNVSLSLSGTGKGVNIGYAFSRFKITPK